MLTSPYADQKKDSWPTITRKLIALFPLPMATLVSVVELAWGDIYDSSFGSAKLQIGKDLFLPAQATGVILEKLIAVRLNERFSEWRGGTQKAEKDIVCTNKQKFSFEIKTSSSKMGLYGNRSTGHRAEKRKKFRTGYYLVINYKLPTESDKSRKIWQIRFGWIDDEDWVGQSEPTGQQASIGTSLAELKLVTIKKAF